MKSLNGSRHMCSRTGTEFSQETTELIATSTIACARFGTERGISKVSTQTDCALPLGRRSVWHGHQLGRISALLMTQSSARYCTWHRGKSKQKMKPKICSLRSVDRIPSHRSMMSCHRPTELSVSNSARNTSAHHWEEKGDSQQGWPSSRSFGLGLKIQTRSSEILKSSASPLAS